MPAIRRFTVTQEREVHVEAATPADAVELANKKFQAKVLPDPKPNCRVTSDIKDTSISAREEY